MKILIIKFRNIGDVLLSTALIKSLKEHFINGSIDVAINDNCKEILKFNPHINKLFCYKRDNTEKNNFMKKINYEILFSYSIYKENYDIVINLTEGDRGNILAIISGAKIKLGYTSKNKLIKIIQYFSFYGKNKILHNVLKDLQFLEYFNITPLDPCVKIYWDKNAANKIENILEKEKIKEFIHIHPVARWNFKCWEDKKIAFVIDYLQKNKGIHVILTSSNAKDEIKNIQNIIQLCETKPLTLAGTLSLNELAYLSSKAKLFFGVDTAPMHIAAAVNTPVIALFGASEQLKWGPWYNGVLNQNYSNKNITTRNKIHTVIQNTHGTIEYINHKKVSSSLLSITESEVITILDSYL